MASRDALIAARQRFLSDGVVPSGVPLPILRSWQRSAAKGIELDKRPLADLPQREELLRALERNENLVQAAWGEIESLCRETQDSGGVVILTDPQGVVLMRVGSTSFGEQADGVGLHPGMDWGEPSVGTNAIGTALAEGYAISIIGAEHFLTVHSVLSCSAAPIIDPSGRIAGALDLSTTAQIPHAYSLALIRRSVEQIERRLFERQCGRQEQMRLHSNPYLVGGPHEGLLAFDGDRLTGANRNAIDLLNLSWSDIGIIRFGQLFSVQHGSIQRNASSDDCIVQTTSGSTLFARMHSPPKAVPKAPDAPPSKEERPASGERAEGEPRVQEVLERLLSTCPPGTLRLRRFKAGHLIYGSDEMDSGEEALLIIRSGQLRCFSSFESRELTLFMLNSGDAMMIHSDTMLEVKKDCEVVSLRQSTFHRLAEEHPPFALAVMPAIERILRRSIKMNEAMAFHSVKYRLVRTLCDAADREGRRTSQGVILETAPSLEDLAMQIGAARQSVSTALAELIRGGLVSRIGASSMLIPSVRKLKAELDSLR
ncbi:GAF domain-containing protein [Consotaella salsifontis]|nr:GAF domain-containing protein [Consotaella salsifontis]